MYREYKKKSFKLELTCHMKNYQNRANYQSIEFPSHYDIKFHTRFSFFLVKHNLSHPSLDPISLWLNPIYVISKINVFTCIWLNKHFLIKLKHYNLETGDCI